MNFKDLMRKDLNEEYSDDLKDYFKKKVSLDGLINTLISKWKEEYKEKNPIASRDPEKVKKYIDGKIKEFSKTV